MGILHAYHVEDLKGKSWKGDSTRTEEFLDEILQDPLATASLADLLTEVGRGLGREHLPQS